MRTNNLLAVGVMAAALEIGAAAQAQSVIFNNLPGTYFGYGPVSAGNLYAESFTTGAESDTLASVTLSFGSEGGQADGGLSVNLYDATGSGSSPGSQLLTLAGNDSPVSGNFTYTGALALSPNTSYWVEADVNPSLESSYAWNVTEDAPAVGSNIGFAYIGVNSGNPDWQMNSVVALQMEVDVNPTVVPEPASAGLLAVGALGLLVRRQRRA